LSGIGGAGRAVLGSRRGHGEARMVEGKGCVVLRRPVELGRAGKPGYAAAWSGLSLGLGRCGRVLTRHGLSGLVRLADGVGRHVGLDLGRFGTGRRLRGGQRAGWLGEAWSVGPGLARVGTVRQSSGWDGSGTGRRWQVGSVGVVCESGRPVGYGMARQGGEVGPGSGRSAGGKAWRVGFGRCRQGRGTGSRWGSWCVG
jgi:hypothetical protein